jgi:hypothetical protein
MATIGETDYRNGARERLNESFILLRKELWGGSVYLAGRAVEGMLRAVIWKGDREYIAGKKSLETGHNLRDMLKLVRNLGVLKDDDLHGSITSDVQKVGRLWWNNMRFLPTTKIQTLWYDLGEIGKRRTMKQATEEYYDACSAVIKRCEALWHSKRS